MAEEHRGFYSPSSSSVLFQDLLCSVPNRNLNSQSEDNKSGSSTHLLDISRASTPLGSDHGPCWHPLPWTATAQGPQPCCFSAADPTAIKPWCCMFPHAEFPVLSRAMSLMDQFREISPPEEFMEPHKERTGSVDALSSAPLPQPAVTKLFLLFLLIIDMNWCLSCSKTTQNSIFLLEHFLPFFTQTVWDALLCTLLQGQVQSDTWNLPSVHQM